MKGFLSYLILWNLSKKEMNGSELAQDLAKRRGSKPSPGTIYPALKQLSKEGLIKANASKTYALTKKGVDELQDACRLYCAIFYDAQEMFKCCKKSSKSC